MRAHTTITAESAVTPPNTNPKGVRGVWRTLLALLTATLLAFSLYPAFSVSSANTQPAHALDVNKWVMCDAFGKDSLPARLYQYSQSNDLQFMAFSKSAAASGRSNPDSGANMLLKVVGVDIEKNNQQLVIGGTDATNGAGFNKGNKLNFFDRFGLGGYQFTAYTGEWNYLRIDACAAKPEAKDPKANHYYETRLDPTATWDRASSSLDPRTQIYATGQGARYASAAGTYIGNILLGATTWVLGFFLALLVLSFKDIAKLMGLTDILVGNNPDVLGGILRPLQENFLFPFASIIVLGGLLFLVKGIIQNDGAREKWKRFGIALFTGIFAVSFIALSPKLLPLPNRAAAWVQSITIKATTQELTSMGEWCSTEVGSKKSTYKAEQEGKRDAFETVTDEVAQVVSENYSEIVASQLSCTFTKLFVFDPWAQGQFGTNPNHLWAEGKEIPEWAKDGKTLGNHNSKWVGDAGVPMGAETYLNNWAIYQLSTQTTSHLQTGNETAGRSREAQGVSTDWWRIVDALSNYDEKDVELKVPQARDLPSNVSNGEWARPAEAAMTSPYGNRPELGDVHKGIDFGAQCGAPIYSAGNGKVVFAQKASDGANGIIIQHDGVSTMYWHMQDGSLQVKAGDEVKAGQQIASSGDTGHAYGCHLHFEVRPGTDWGNQDNVTDPQAWLKERNIDVTKEKDGLSPHAAAVSTGNSSSAVEITRGAQDMDSKPLAAWNTWVGSSSGARVGVGLSALIVAIIALAVPSILALMTAILSVLIQLYILVVPFAALALMTSTKRGIAFAKKYGKMALYLYFARIGLGLLLTLSVVFVLWGYSIMATVGFWQGVVVIALLSLALWLMKNRIIAFAETYAGGLVRKPMEALDNIGLGFKRLTGIGTASVVSGVTAKRAGGSFLQAASIAAADKKRDIANESKFGRLTLRASNKANEFAPSRLLKPQGHTPTVDDAELLVCSNCKRTYKHGEMNMFMDKLTKRMYCQRCKSEGLIPNSELLVPIKNKADEKKAKKRMKPTNDTYLTMALAQPELQRENVKSDADAFKAYKTLTTAAADSMARHHRSALDERQKSVIVYELPEALKPYFNVDAYNIARDNDDFEKMRRHWGLAIHKYIQEELGYKINRTPEETLNDIVRTSDGYSPWWMLDPNAKRNNEGNQTDE